MADFKQQERIKELTRLPQVKLLFMHGKLGLGTALAGIIILVGVQVLHSAKRDMFPDFWWSALLSVPVTLLCMGLFSTFYEWYMRTTFTNSMRSLYWAWDTGVTVFPTHEHAPDRKQVLERVHKNGQVRIMSTTLNRYFLFTYPLVCKKADEGVTFKFILYNPDSVAIKEKAREENRTLEYFQDEIEGTCHRYLSELKEKYGDKVLFRFCDFNTPFGITIIDDREMVLSLNIYGLARSKNETPCLIIETNMIKTVYSSCMNNHLKQYGRNWGILFPVPCKSALRLIQAKSNAVWSLV